MINTKNTLALRYRPRKFNQVVGQQNLIAVLEGIVKTKSIPNALAFLGMSGVGKTTSARLLARYINCETGNACGKCRSCKEIDKDKSPDYQEINAGAMGGVDAMRNLITTAQFQPQNTLRIIVIDECHRLTAQAVDALLKPLEEPPENTLWILCSSEPDKIPNGTALLGRCQKFMLETPTKEDIDSRLQHIIKKEEYTWAKKLSPYIAESCGGHVRDAIQILEQCAGMAAASKLKGNELRKSIKHFIVEGSSGDAGLDLIAGNLLTGLYKQDVVTLQTAILEITSGNAVQVINKMIWANQFLLSTSTIKGKHSKIWWTPLNRKLANTLKKKLPGVLEIAGIHGYLMDIKSDLFTPQVDSCGVYIKYIYPALESLLEED